ncbi:MAG: STAS domain-containing protein [Candidatus Cybelea sp.]
MKKSRAIKVIRLGGELEIGRKDEIRESLASSDAAAAVLLDLGTVTYADSIALTELLRFCVEAARKNRPVALVIQTPQFARLVQYAGLASAFKIFSESAAAMEYLGDCAQES